VQTAVGGDGPISSEAWAKALSSALQNLYTYTRARPPSRTLVDPLDAFVSTLAARPNAVGDAVKAATFATESTRDVEAKAGRSAYVESDVLKRERVPDPGAWGVKVILNALASSV